MALGMKDPSYWGPNEQFAAATKKTLSPLRTWSIKSGLTNRTLTITDDANDTTLYTTASHSAIKKNPHVTLHRGSDDTSAIAGARLDGQHSGSYHVYLGEPPAEHSTGGQECEVVYGGNTFTRQHRFSPPAEQKDYAWRDTAQYEISIADTKVETTGRDWKFISLTPDGEEDELLAAYVHSPKASLKYKAQVFWFAHVSEQVELWALAAVAGLVERQGRSKEKFNLMTMVGAGATM